MIKKSQNKIGKERIYNSFFENHKKDVIRWEVISINQTQCIKVRFISVNSNNRQGVRIAIDSGEGFLVTNDVRGKNFEIWEDECPSEIEIQCFSEEGLLSVYNIFEEIDWTGKKRKYSQMDYSGMILERTGHIFRYSCNNAELNSEFDKLVFEIELLDIK